MLKSFKFLLVVLIGILTIFLAYRGVVLNNFNFLPGDRYDMVIMSSLLEHWKNFWIGQSSWYDAGYFYPYQRTIAQTDGYFLIGGFYSIIRIFSDDVFISVIATSVVLSCIGFFSFYLFAQKVLMFRFETSLLIASSFVLLNSVVSHHQRLQLMSIFLLPILSFFLLFYLRSVHERNQVIIGTFSGCIFGVFYGAMTITSFYIAWFYGFFLIITFFVVFCFKKNVVIDWTKNFVFLKSLSFVVTIVFLLSLVPFIWAYYPKSLEVGVRSFSSVSGNLIAPLEIIQLGFDNYLYGVLLKHVFQFFYPGYTPWGEYYNVGYSPLIFGLYIASLFYFFPKAKTKEVNAFFIISVSALICCIFLFKVKGFSLWYLVYNLVPGAKALNVASIFLIVLAFPILVVVGKYIDSQNLNKSLFAVIASFVILGELTPTFNNLNRKIENERVSEIPAPPKDCRVFYVAVSGEQAKISEPSESVYAIYAHNVTAMLISQMIGLPTINGIASFNPPDWNFSAPWVEDYSERVKKYAEKHKIDRLCSLDLGEKIWHVMK
ncbi:hypothetical protein [Comamonas sp.]|uniref:hypothetical protein n=1 Tax=Comamonas sp. TaxID=34028 RepID=UPI00289E573D|nr:hypothetical protein [Comamonas sp.]